LNLSEVGPVALIGAGKMGLALAKGWIAGGLPPRALMLVDPEPSDAATRFAVEHGVALSGKLEASPKVLVLAVKPQVAGPVMAGLQPRVTGDTLAISIAAGISIASLAAGLGTERVIRTMPNTPAQLGKGMTGAVAGPGLRTGDRETADALLAAAGEVVWFDEERAIDAVTSVSGSGPAYVFHLVEALAAAGEKQGLNAEQAMLLARQTIIGAAALLEADPSPASTLRENVTSPNGTTAAALAVLMAPDGLGALVDKAVAAARKRSEELGRS
jgi:pyrroline-5-carboxylate reductase